MAQATSPDVVLKHEDVPMSTPEETQATTGEKKSVLGKLKDKTHKLKRKLKPGSGAEAADDTSSSSSSDEEADAPSSNVISGTTHPEYQRKLESGQMTTDEDSRLGRKSGNTEGLAVDDFNKKSPADFPPSHGQGDFALSKQFEGLSTDDKPSSQMDTTSDSTIPSEKFGVDTSPEGGLGGKIDRESATKDDDILSKAGNPHADDLTCEKAKSDPEGLIPSEGEKAAEPVKSWGQWVGEKVGLAKDSSKTATTTPSTTTSAEKPMTEKAKDSILGAKDVVVGKTNEVIGAATTTIGQTKDDTATTGTDPSKQTYTQKLTGAIYGAKDSLMSSTHPGDEDKALSQKVTETVSNLPGTIKSTLGFGGNKTGADAGVASPTTTPTTGTSDALSAPSATEESPAAPPQSPGIVSRITDSVSSLWGKKEPTSTSLPSSTTTAGTADSSGLSTAEATPTTGTDTPTL